MTVDEQLAALGTLKDSGYGNYTVVVGDYGGYIHTLNGVEVDDDSEVVRLY